MTPDLFLKGLLIGFSIAMPVGPIGLLCIRNVLSFGLMCGLLTGLGAACADALYGALAGFGITAIGSFLEAYSGYLQVVGALFLCYLGASTFCAKGSASNTQETSVRLSEAFLVTFVLTLTNPMTILSFAGVYAGLGLGVGSPNVTGALIITLGVFLGSAVWWLILSLTSSLFRDKINAKTSVWLNKLSGSVIFGFGVFALTTYYWNLE